MRAALKNPITLTLPALVYDECFLPTVNMGSLFKKIRRNLDTSFWEVSVQTHYRFFNIFNTLNIHEESFKSNGGFGILRLLAWSNKWSSSDLSYLFVADDMIK